jgi:hypothetical protein
MPPKSRSATSRSFAGSPRSGCYRSACSGTSSPSTSCYDLFKEFELEGNTVGVAIEIERWEIHQDLLKFRRGHERALIVCGVILSDGPACLDYIYKHARDLSEPLFGHIPVLYCAPDGPGLAQDRCA